MGFRAKEIAKEHFGKGANPYKATNEIVTMFFDEARLESSKVHTAIEVQEVWRKWAQKWLDVCYTVTIFRLNRKAFMNKVGLVYPNLYIKLGWPKIEGE